MKHAKQELLKGPAPVPIFVALICLSLTAVAWVAAAQAVKSRDRNRFLNEEANISSTIQGRLDRQVQLLNATRAMLMLSPNITRKQFKQYADEIDLKDNYPGSRGIGWSVQLAPSQVESFVQDMEAQGIPGIAVKPALGETHAIMVVEPPPVTTPHEVGVNLFSEADRRAAMIAARATDSVTMTGVVYPLTEKDMKNPSFLMFEPVYWKSNVPPDRRLAEFRGFVFSPFRAQDLIEKILEKPYQLSIHIYTAAEMSPRNLLWATPGSGNGKLRGTSQVKVAGQTWTVLYESNQLFESGSWSIFLTWIPVIGILVSAIMAGLSWRQSQAANEIAVQAALLERRVLHQQLLARAGDLIDQRLDQQRILESLSSLAVPVFADYSTVDMPSDDGVVRRISVAHYKPEMEKIIRDLDAQYPDRTEHPSIPATVMRTGEPFFAPEITQHPNPRLVDDERYRQLIAQLGTSSVIVVPMTARGKTLGSMTFAYTDSGRRYNGDDFEVAREFGSRAGLAIENSQLFQEAQSERAKVEQLNEKLGDLVQERTAELEQSNRELEAFSYSVSHDLRGPLRSVDGFSRALLDDYQDILDETATGYLVRVRGAARRMDELITSLLKLSRITRASMARSQIDMSALAHAAAEDIVTEGMPIQIDIQEGMTAFGDDKMLHVVYDNLIANAAKFSAKRDHPVIEVGKEGKVFFVRDNGVGFNAEYANKLFVPFERLHGNDQFPGSGIGLATVERIIKRHGGVIWAESKENEGATFFFTLP